MGAITVETADWPSVVQAFGSILAIAAGFAYIAVQRGCSARAAADAAGRLARHSVDRVTERMAALIDPAQPIEFALRGQRASEMILVLRELDLSRLPARYIEPIASIRSSVYAINQRIDDILTGESRRRSQRRARLHSAARILAEARAELSSLTLLYPHSKRSSMTPSDMSADMIAFLEEAAAAGSGTD